MVEKKYRKKYDSIGLSLTKSVGTMLTLKVFKAFMDVKKTIHRRANEFIHSLFIHGWFLAYFWRSAIVLLPACIQVNRSVTLRALALKPVL